MGHILKLESGHRTTSKVLLQAAISLLVLIALLDPTDFMLHLKTPAFAMIFLIWIYRQTVLSRWMDGERNQRLPSHVWITTLGLSIVVPMLWIMVGLLRSGLHTGDVPFGLLKTFLFFSIVLVLVSENINLISYINRASTFLAIITIGMAVLNLVSPEVFLGVSLFIANKGNGIIAADRNLFGLGIGEFYYGACPVMVFPFAYHFHQVCNDGLRKFSSTLLCLLFGAALILTGARAEILATLAVSLLFILRYIRRAFGWAPVLLIGTAMLLVGAVAVIPKFTDTQENSNELKLKHVRSYYQEFSSMPGVLFTGEGANSEFYSEGFEGWTPVTEVTYMELVRVFGLPMVLLFIAGLFWIGFRLFSAGMFDVGLAYAAFLGIAASNPLLVGSSGFLVIAAVYEQAMKHCGSSAPKQSRFRLWGHTSANRG